MSDHEPTIKDVLIEMKGLGVVLRAEVKDQAVALRAKMKDMRVVLMGRMDRVQDGVTEQRSEMNALMELTVR